MVQVTRDGAGRVLGVRWSRKPEVTDYKVDMRTIPRVVWRCVQVEKYSFCIVIVTSFIMIM